MARRTRSDGEQTRAAVVSAAADLATTQGLDGLSIAELADAVGMSKSGLFAHFGSKEQLQLATIGHAEEIFEREVIAPALETPDGVGRLRALVEANLSYLDRDVFPGGCFFASTQHEFAARPGPVRDRLARAHQLWLDLLTAAATSTQHEGSLEPTIDPEQLAFELAAIIIGANWTRKLLDDDHAISRARHACARMIDAATLDQTPADAS